MASLVEIRLALCGFKDAELGDGTWTPSSSGEEHPFTLITSVKHKAFELCAS